MSHHHRSAPDQITFERNVIAARIAAASEVFPIDSPGEWDSRVDVSAEGDVITVLVTEHRGRRKREYRAVLQLIAETTAAPANPGVGAPGEDRHVSTIHQESETRP